MTPTSEPPLFPTGAWTSRAAEVFAGPHTIAEDIRVDYGEPRFVSVGYLDDRMVVVAWTPRDQVRRVISMRKANEREQATYQGQLG